MIKESLICPLRYSKNGATYNYYVKETSMTSELLKTQGKKPKSTYRMATLNPSEASSFLNTTTKLALHVAVEQLV